MIEILLDSLVIIFLYATGWFMISLIVKRNDIADIAWGIGYVILAAYYLLSFEASTRLLLLFILVLAWGLRLTIHIAVRNRGKSEDFRYKKWRDEWGKFFYVRSYLQVYLLQGVFLLLIVSPLGIVAGSAQRDLNWLDIVGFAVWLVGFYFESVSDYQLMKFKEDPANRGEIIQHGLWKYSRHPNYFGEVTMWWGVFIIALSSTYGLFAIISPLTITSLILLVSGIPMLEKKYVGNPQYDQYKKKTSAFIPLPQ